jgi:hypothetical protein
MGAGKRDDELAVESQPTASDNRARARVTTRVITVELATRFAEELAGDMSHSVESAALASGIRPGTVREAIHRYEHDKCTTAIDEEVCEILVKGKAEHIKQIRAAGYISAGRENRAGTSWMQWQLEVQAPKEHPRKTQVELSGEDGKPIETNNTSTVTYVVAVPPDEESDDEEAEG